MNEKNIVSQSDFPKELLGAIRDFYRNGTFTDLTVVSQDGVHYLVHRAVVCASSTEICATHHMPGGTHMTDVSSLQLQLLIDFMYSGELHISTKTVYALLQGATSLGIEAATQLCLNFIREYPDLCAEHTSPEIGDHLLRAILPTSIKSEPANIPDEVLGELEQEAAPVKRKRGRPRKDCTAIESTVRGKRKCSNLKTDTKAKKAKNITTNHTQEQISPPKRNSKDLPLTNEDSVTLNTKNCDRLLMEAACVKVGDYKWTCKICSRKFRFCSTLQLHFRKHGIRQLMGWPMNLYYYSGLKAGKMVVVDNESFKCTICPATYKTIWTAKSHVSQRHILKTVQCLSCNQSVVKGAVYRQHIRKFHSKIPSLLRCQICPQKAYLHKTNLYKHVIEKHPTEKKAKKKFKQYRKTKTRQSKRRPNSNKQQRKLPWKCDEGDCSQSFSNECELTRHIDQTHPGVSHSCLICGYSNKIHKNLLKHMRIKHKRKSANIPVCEICDKLFSRNSQVVRHKFSRHRIVDPSMQLFACEFPKCTYVAVHKEGLRHHQTKHQQEKLFSCDICDKKLKTAKNVEKHKNKVHHNIRPYICDQCGQSYGEHAELRTHLARHGVTKSFHCEQCPYSTHEKGNFKSHLYCRHGIKLEERMVIYQCEQCDFSTDSKTRFHDHMKCHNNIRDLPCPDCGKLFVTRKCLRGHVVKVHGSKSLTCNYCGYATADKSKLNIHLKVMHTQRGFKPYKCAYCDFCCATSGNCRKHVMHKHKGLEVKYEKLLNPSSNQNEISTEPMAVADAGVLQSSHNSIAHMVGSEAHTLLPKSENDNMAPGNQAIAARTNSVIPAQSEKFMITSQPGTVPVMNIVGQTGYELFHTILGQNITM